ncbi:MAG: peptidoglycan bridge formation glycyltransferase FemA/FemB family protein [candidate division KSB1 bacterium]|nr:peptidoglycan bridge formation glycyltransferase FemA/FemB family protein [candidate division KSB1 bacterium]
MADSPPSGKGYPISNPQTRVSPMDWRIEQITPHDSSIGALIDPWLNVCPSATIFHTVEWNIIVQEVFQTTCKYFLAHEGGRLVGVFPCHMLKQGPWLTVCYSPPRQYEVSYGGPVAVGSQAAKICAELVRAAGRMQVGVVVQIFNSPKNTAWVNKSEWKKVTTFETAYVDLSQPLEAIWSLSLDGKRRNMIRKAERNGVCIKNVAIEGLDEFYPIVQKMCKRSGLSLKPKLYYRRILEAFEPQGKAKLFLGYMNDKPVVGGIFLRHQDVAYYWIGATDTEIGNFGAGELLQWHVIQWAKQSGCAWYDLVGIERERLPHIAIFKLGFTRHIEEFRHVNYASLLTRIIRRAQHLLCR